MSDEQRQPPSQSPAQGGKPSVGVSTRPATPSDSQDANTNLYPELPFESSGNPAGTTGLSDGPTGLPTTPGTTRAKSTRGCLTTGLTVVFRLMLLGVGIPVGWLLGVGVANFWPSSATEPPLQEVALRKTNRIVTEVRRLPSRWQDPVVEQTRVEPVPIPTEPVPSLTTPAQVLSEQEQKVIEDDLVAIATELGTLDKRLIDLETRLGHAQSTASVESRIASLKASLNNSGSDAAASTDNTSLTSTPTETAPDESSATNQDQVDPLFRVTDLQVTLPSDALFVPGEARLLETAPPLLNTILSELNRYPNATVLIGSHTDDRNEQTTSRELSFQQAMALKLYLAQNFPQERRWVTLGYGQSQPITQNQTPEARQRNRRVEIWVDRR